MKEDIHRFGKKMESTIKKLFSSEGHFFEEDKEDLKRFYN